MTLRGIGRSIVVTAAALVCLLPAGAQAKPGDLYVSETMAGDPGRITVFNPSTGALTPLVQGAGLVDPQDAVFGRDGFLYVADSGGAGTGGVFKVDPATGAVSPFSGFGPPFDTPRAIDFGPAGELYVADFGNDTILKIDPATGAAAPFVQGSLLPSPIGMSLARDGLLYVGNGTDSIVRIDPATAAATTFVASPSALDDPEGIDQDPISGLLYIADNDRDFLFTLDPLSAVLTQLPGTTATMGSQSDLAFTPTELYTINGGDRLSRADRATGTGTDVTPPGALTIAEGLTVEPPKCAGKTATIVGSGGADTITGTEFADVISVLGGKDRVSAGKGKDIVCGGKGKDKLNGGAGKDKLRGEGGKDRLAGGKGSDTCTGGKGDDSDKACEKGKV